MRYGYRFPSVVSVIIFLFSIAEALAGEVQPVTIRCTVPIIQDMRLSSGTYLFPTPTDDDFSAGYIQTQNAITVTVSSNTAWELTIHTNYPHLGTARNYTKPLKDFLWCKKGGALTAITNIPAAVEVQPAFSKARNIDLDYRMLLDWRKDKPGYYELGLTFTLISSQ